MKREELIAYSFYYGGEYNKVYQAIKENKKIAPLKIDNAVTILDDHYPRAFLDLKYPPFVFYYYGDLDLFNKQIYGIVGSRDPCPYALEATMALAMHYSDKVIVSGLAKGIDAHAHRYAAKTIGPCHIGISIHVQALCLSFSFPQPADRRFIGKALCHAKLQTFRYDDQCQ